MPTTEIASHRLVAGSNISDPKNEAAIKLEELVRTVLKKDCARSFYHGMQDERPEMLEVLITYDSTDGHDAWMKNPEYDPTNLAIGPIFAGLEYLYHVDFELFDQFEAALKCPVTEIATFYFGREPSPDYLHTFQNFSEAAVQENGGLIASAAGITYEQLEYEGGKAKAAVFIAGWESMEAHTAFKNTETYKTHMPILANGVEKVDVRHISLRHV